MKTQTFNQILFNVIICSCKEVHFIYNQSLQKKTCFKLEHSGPLSGYEMHMYICDLSLLFHSSEMKVTASLQQDCVKILILFSLNRQIIVETGTEKQLRRQNVLAVTFFLNKEKLTCMLPEGSSCLRESIKKSSITGMCESLHNPQTSAMKKSCLFRGIQSVKNEKCAPD